MITKKRLTFPLKLVSCAIKVGGTDSLGQSELLTSTKFGHVSLNVSSKEHFPKLRRSREGKSSAREVMTQESAENVTVREVS